MQVIAVIGQQDSKSVGVTTQELFQKCVYLGFETTTCFVILTFKVSRLP